MNRNDRTVRVRRFLGGVLGCGRRDLDESLPDPPGPQEHAENVEFMAEALEGIPRPKTVFDCIDERGKITDEGWALLGLENPHKWHAQRTRQGCCRFPDTCSKCMPPKGN